MKPTKDKEVKPDEGSTPPNSPQNPPGTPQGTTK